MVVVVDVVVASVEEVGVPEIKLSDLGTFDGFR